MFKLLAATVLLCLYTKVISHPHRLSPMPKVEWTPGNLPKVLSYHIHCVFVNSDINVVKKAMTLHDQFRDQFNLTGVPECATTFDDKRLCMFGRLLFNVII